MPQIDLAVRFFSGELVSSVISLDTAKTAFVVVDSDVGLQTDIVIEKHLAPALATARQTGIKVLYFHPDADGVGGPQDVTRELHGTRHHSDLPELFFDKPQWRSWQPTYPASIAPLLGEPDFPKSSKDGFETTNADYYLKSWGIDTLIAVGFALRSCLYHTCMGARHRNYRVVMLRDCTTPPGSGEFPDTRDETNPEGGWMRFVFLRQFETNIGYTSTSVEFQKACGSPTAPKADTQS
jgi:nicotinamidase-related amidase